VDIYVVYYSRYKSIVEKSINKRARTKEAGLISKTQDLLSMFYSRPESIASGFLNKVTNYSILRFNLSLSEYYLPSESRPRKASLKRLRKRLSRRLPRPRKKSSGRLRRATKPRSLTCGYGELNTWAIWPGLIKSRFGRLWPL
jgi:hypothetical protein